jgi:hypothetical protein
MSLRKNVWLVGPAQKNALLKLLRKGNPMLSMKRNVPNVEAVLRYARLKQLSKNETEEGRGILLNIFPFFPS